MSVNLSHLLFCLQSPMLLNFIFLSYWASYFQNHQPTAWCWCGRAGRPSTSAVPPTRRGRRGRQYFSPATIIISGRYSTRREIHQRREFIKENKKVRKRENKNSTKKAIKKKLSFFLYHFLGRVLVFFLFFLFSFINSHLRYSDPV